MLHSQNQQEHGPPYQDPRKGPSLALLLVDVINDLEFDEGDQLLQFARPAAPKLRALAERFRGLGLPVIYANDNFGKWQSDFNAQVQHCLEEGVRGKPIVEQLVPHDEDYFVLKPKHSAFYGTTLEILLRSLTVETLVITGFATDICVLFTANDAYMRDYKVVIPGDCVAANSAQRTDSALQLMQQVLKADIHPSTEVRLPGTTAPPH
ncbi:cysteine hydrolase family protein [Roseimaritima sediminicola]|uniref:cysteine hydrolase family protein n=1 Tax=Roseimaritima sediminicola TaxID=2662066 RepID=UPI001F1B376B|nr:isochorismatase family cysteine hydrolase [Roseimaritima sediminicola]